MMDIQDPYVAYCFDQAVGFLGVSIENELEEAGHKPSKGEGKAKAARKRVLDKHFPPKGGDTKRFADPAMLFQ